jgi:hypothetical protein
MFQFTNRQAAVFCIVMLIAAGLIIWGLNHAVHLWFPGPYEVPWPVSDASGRFEINSSPIRDSNLYARG